ncbi:MAG: hypothetical protein ACRDWA_04250 [Acidimicrobiia bacterium]
MSNRRERDVIGNVPEGLLTAKQEKALDAGVSLVIDMFLDDLFLLASNGEFEDTNMSGHLPARFAHLYTRGFARKFFVSAVTVSWKLAQPGSWPLGCVAEELALQAIVDHAEEWLSAGESTEDLADFLDLATKDGDYQLLFDMAWDGIEDSREGRDHRVWNLRFEDWFEPFYDEVPVHPYVASDTSSHS